MIDQDFCAVTVHCKNLDKIFSSNDFDLTPCNLRCEVKDLPEHRKDRFALFTGRMHLVCKVPAEDKLRKLIEHLRVLGHSITRSHRLVRNDRRMENGDVRRESRAEACQEYLSMGTKPIPFSSVYLALTESGLSKIRVYIPYNRKQPLMNWFIELGAVFDEDQPLYDHDTVTDVGVTWHIDEMVVFGLLKTDLVKNCKTYPMHLCAGQGGGSLEFHFTDSLLRGVKACIYPEAARWVKASKRCGHKPSLNRSSFRNQCNGQELLAHFLTEMVSNGRLQPLMGYRIEYRIERSPNIFQTVRNLRDNDLFRWSGLRAYLGDSIQRMVITDAFLTLAEWFIPAAKSLLWDKGGHPSEMDTMRTIEVWNFFGINSYWQQREQQIKLNMLRWVRTGPYSQRPADSDAADITLDLEHEEQLAQIPEHILDGMRRRVRLRPTPNRKKWTVTLANTNHARPGSFAQPDDLYLSIYQEYGELWHRFVRLQS